MVPWSHCVPQLLRFFLFSSSWRYDSQQQINKKKLHNFSLNVDMFGLWSFTCDLHDVGDKKWKLILSWCKLHTKTRVPKCGKPLSHSRDTIIYTTGQHIFKTVSTAVFSCVTNYPLFSYLLQHRKQHQQSIHSHYNRKTFWIDQ